MNNTKQTTGAAVGFFDLLGIAFIVLKMCGVIAWPWWLVLLPIYGPLALVLLILIAGLLIALVKAVTNND